MSSRPNQTTGDSPRRRQCSSRGQLYTIPVGGNIITSSTSVDPCMVGVKGLILPGFYSSSFNGLKHPFKPICLTKQKGYTACRHSLRMRTLAPIAGPLVFLVTNCSGNHQSSGNLPSENISYLHDERKKKNRNALGATIIK